MRGFCRGLWCWNAPGWEGLFLSLVGTALRVEVYMEILFGFGVLFSLGRVLMGGWILGLLGSLVWALRLIKLQYLLPPPVL